MYLHIPLGFTKNDEVLVSGFTRELKYYDLPKYTRV